MCIRRQSFSICLISPSKVLQRGEPYPQVILPEFGGYWIEDPDTPAAIPNWMNGFCDDEDGEGRNSGEFGYVLESNFAIRAYRKHFIGRVRTHINIVVLYLNGPSDKGFWQIFV